MIMSQPNGSQQYPDILVIRRGIGIPLEIKSGKDDKVVWNSGLPRNGGIYLFNRYRGPGDTSFFLGDHVLDDEEDEVLREARRLMEEAVRKANETLASQGRKGRWSTYPRPMYNFSEKVLAHPQRDERENDVLMHVRDIVEDRIA